MHKWNACLVLLAVHSVQGLFGQTPPVTLADIPGIVAPGTPVILVKGGYCAPDQKENP
jgi:hypothetical protein